MKNTRIEAIGYGETFLAYLIWGVLPIFWKQLTDLNSIEVISARIIGSFILLFVIVTIKGENDYKKYLKDRLKRKALVISGILISINWFIFIYAVNNNYVVQASFGYYINPIVSILIGMILLKEKMKTFQYVALSMVLIAVVYMGLGIGQFPWISLILAFSFGFYGFLKKKNHLNSTHSLMLELLVALPFLVIYVMITLVNGTSSYLSLNLYQWIFIVLAGVVTVVPLILFGNGAKKIPLSSVGIMQYLAPSMMLGIGVLMYNEPFTKTYQISFLLIWIGVIFYMTSLFRHKKS